MLPFLDELRFLAGAVETVRNQDLDSWELLLVDDGSTDGSGALADRLAAEEPSRIRVLRHPGHLNRGLPASRNLGLDAARGDAIAFLDADDRWVPHKLTAQLDILDRRRDIAMTCGPTWSKPSDAEGPGVLTPVDDQAPRQYEQGAFARALLAKHVVPPAPSSVMIRTACLRSVGGVPDGDHHYEDQRTYVAVNLAHDVYVSDVPLCTYAVRPDSLCGSVADDQATRWKQRQRFERWLLRRALRQGVPGLPLALHACRRQLIRLAWKGRQRIRSRRRRSRRSS